MQRKLIFGSIAVAVILAAGIVYMLEFPPQGDAFSSAMNQGKNYYDKGDAAKALAAFRKAAALQPANRDAQLNVANAALLLGESDAAIKAAQDAIALDNNSAAAHYVKGCALLRLSKFDDALKELQIAYDLDPTVAAAPFQLGRAHIELGHVEEAITSFQDCIALEPEHPAAHYALSQALIRSGKQTEATQELEKHRQIAAKHPAGTPTAATYERSKHTLARASFKLEQPAKNGIKVSFTDMTATLGASKDLHGPVGIIDFNRDGTNSLFVGEADGFRLLANENGKFVPRGEHVPGLPGVTFHRCLVGDLQNDRYDDVVALGNGGTLVFKFATNGAVTEVSRMARLNDVAATDGALVDLDFTGKLDLLVLSTNGSLRLLRNLGNLYFRESTATSGIPATLQGARQVLVDDWNNDDLMDVIATRPGQAPLLLTKLRGGPLTNSPADWPKGTVVAAGDLNNDLRTDLAVGSDAGIEIVLAGSNKHLTLPTAGWKINRLALLDYDNDGWLDVVALGNGIRVWRNRGDAGFVEATKETGLDKLSASPLKNIQTADLDNDGDSDLVLTTGANALLLLRNDGGNANQQLKLRLMGNRSNSSGLGVRVEVNAGGLRLIRTVSQPPVEIGVGAHKDLDAVTVHWFDLADNILDVKVQRDPLTLFELQLPTGSCPFLYAWDGSQFRFVSDILGAAPLGLRLTDTRFIEADPDEYVWIGNQKSFPAREGRYAVQITEELREVLYLDFAELVAVDHPRGTEVHTTGKLLPGKPFPKPELVTLQNPRPLLGAVRSDGLDVTEALRQIDGSFASPVKLRVPQLRGLAEPYSVTLDFGPLEVNKPLVLALTGWLRFGGGMANVAASHNPDLPFPFPQLEVEREKDHWEPVKVVVGAPAGKTKTILVDLAGKLPADSRRLRISTAFEINWDRIELFNRASEAETRVQHLAAEGTDLHWRGFSDYRDLPWTQPLTPDYRQVRSAPKWIITPEGWVTRYGPVQELISRQDNALALVNSGDELTLTFAELPAVGGQGEREFFLHSVGWDKDADFHVEKGWAVGPLPFHGMEDQLYGQEEGPAGAWIQKYNTRWSGPRTLHRIAKH